MAQNDAGLLGIGGGEGLVERLEEFLDGGGGACVVEAGLNGGGCTLGLGFWSFSLEELLALSLRISFSFMSTE